MAIFPQRRFKQAAGTAVAMYTGGRYSGVKTPQRSGGGFNSVTYRKRKRNTTNYKSFRQKVLALESAHHKTANDATLLISGARHNNMYTHNITAQIAQGTTNFTRVGDNIHLEAIKLSGYYGADSALANGQVIRIMLFYADIQDNTGGTGFANGAITTSDVFIDTTSGALTVNGIVDPKKVQVIYDETHTMNHGLSGSVEVENIWINLQLQKSFTYTPSEVYGKNTNLYLLFTGGTSGGATGTTDIGDLNMSYDLIFKNTA